jgi:hypothetical protein
MSLSTFPCRSCCVGHRIPFTVHRQPCTVNRPPPGTLVGKCTSDAADTVYRLRLTVSQHRGGVATGPRSSRRAPSQRGPGAWACRSQGSCSRLMAEDPGSTGRCTAWRLRAPRRTGGKLGCGHVLSSSVLGWGPVTEHLSNGQRPGAASTSAAVERENPEPAEAWTRGCPAGYTKVVIPTGISSQPPQWGVKGAGGGVGG